MNTWSQIATILVTFACVLPLAASAGKAPKGKRTPLLHCSDAEQTEVSSLKPWEPDLKTCRDHTEAPWHPLDPKEVKRLKAGHLHLPSWGNDSGVITDRFLTLPNLSHAWRGVDVSTYNCPRYEKLKDCGAQFAIVRLDRAHAKHIEGFRATGILTIPYYNIELKHEKYHGTFMDHRNYPNPEEFRANPQTWRKSLDELAADIDVHAATEAKKFLTAVKANYPDGLPLLAISKTLPERQLVAVDVEYKMTAERAYPKKKSLFGKMYARAVCTWVRAVKHELPDALIILYTTPSVYKEYFKDVDLADAQVFPAYEKDLYKSCLDPLPKWISRTTPSGGPGTDIFSDAELKEADKRDLCFGKSASLGNKCILHQYTHRAVFGVNRYKERERFPPHIDINRLFPVKAVRNEFGLSIVREQ